MSYIFGFKQKGNWAGAGRELGGSMVGAWWDTVDTCWSHAHAQRARGRHRWAYAGRAGWEVRAVGVVWDVYELL